MTREDAASKRSVRVNDGNSKDIKVVRCNITLDTKTKFLFIVPITNYHASYYDNHKTIEQRYAAGGGKELLYLAAGWVKLNSSRVLQVVRVKTLLLPTLIFY